MDDKDIKAAILAAIEAGKARERKFTETVELAINLKDVDLKVPANRIQEEVILPHGLGKEVKLGIFASGELAVKARESFDTVIAPEEISDLAGEKKKAKQIANDHSFFVSDATLMPTIGRFLGIVLGPRGKMPKPVPPQVDPAPLADSLRRSVRVRSKEKRTFHVQIGASDMAEDELVANFKTIWTRVMSRLERGAQNIDAVFLKTSMGPSIKLNHR